MGIYAHDHGVENIEIYNEVPPPPSPAYLPPPPLPPPTPKFVGFQRQACGGDKHTRHPKAGSCHTTRRKKSATPVRLTCAVAVNCRYSCCESGRLKLAADAPKSLTTAKTMNVGADSYRGSRTMFSKVVMSQLAGVTWLQHRSMSSLVSTHAVFSPPRLTPVWVISPI